MEILPARSGTLATLCWDFFDAIAEPAGLAFSYLACGQLDSYRELMVPAEKLSRTIFEVPTGNYKAGLALLSWLNGHQKNFMLVNHEERSRNLDHYLRVVKLATEAPGDYKRLLSFREAPCFPGR